MAVSPEVHGSLEQVRVRLLPDGRMSATDAAAYLGLDSKTLTNWRVEEKGPGYIKVGGRVFYYKDDLDTFIRGKAA